MVIRRFCSVCRMRKSCHSTKTASIPCDYEDTDSYQITRVFINHRESLLRHLLGNET